MIFSKSQKESLISRVTFMEAELADLERFKEIEWEIYLKDSDKRKIVERIIENIVNAMIDISKIVISDKSSGAIPSTYADVIIKLAEFDIIKFDLSSKLSEYVKLRNILAHQYLDLRWDKIKHFLKDAPDKLSEFIKQVKKTIYTETQAK